MPSKGKRPRRRTMLQQEQVNELAAALVAAWERGQHLEVDALIEALRDTINE